jgi:hypothetical protein
MRASNILSRWERVRELIRASGVRVAPEKFFWMMLYIAREGSTTVQEARDYLGLSDDWTRRCLQILTKSGILSRLRMEPEPNKCGPGAYLWMPTATLYTALAIQPEPITQDAPSR